MSLDPTIEQTVERMYLLEETVQHACSLPQSRGRKTRSISTRAYMRSSRATLEKMLDAAAEMFSKKGFAATTFRDVASEGAINNNSIFRRILNKQDLGKQALKWESDKIQFKKLLTEATSKLDPSDPANVESLVLVLVKTVTESRLAVLCLRAMEGECDQEIRQFAETNFILPIMILLEAFLKECVRRGRIRPCSPLVLSQLLLGPIVSILMTQFHWHKKADQDSKSLAGMIVQNWLHGVSLEGPS